MFCPTCQTVSWTAPGTCPTCGSALRAVTVDDAVEVVEATAEVGLGEPSDDADPPLDATMLAVAPAARPTLPVSVRLAELSVAAWRQPAVRAAVKTGASALALSLAMRAARHVLSRSENRRTLARSALPALTDFLRPDAPDERERGAVVIETFVYMRRVVRR